MSAARGRMVTELGSDAPSMARGAAANVSGALLTTGFSFALVLLITHTISAHSFGLFTIASTVILLAQVPALLGLDTGAVRFVALGAAADDERTARGSLQTALLIVSAASLVLTVALVWTAPWLADQFFGKPGATQLIRIVSLSLPGLVLARVVIAGLQGLGVMTYSAWLNPIRVFVNILSAVPLLALGLGARGLAYASVITAWCTLLIGLAFLLRVHPAALRPVPSHWAFRRVLRFSLPQSLTTMLLYIMLWTDILLLGRLGAAGEVAVYRVAQNLLSPAQAISTSTGQMFAPRIAAEDAEGDRATLGMMLKRVTYWNIALSLPVFLLLLLLAKPLLGLFGPRYEDGATALVILAAGQLFNAATGPLGQVINMSGRPYITMTNNAAVAGLNIIGCVILIPRYGITGAACSTTASITLVNLIKLVEVRVIFGINPFRAQALRSLGAGALAAAIVAPIAVLWPWSTNAVEVLALGSLLLLLYALFFWWVAAGDEERTLIRRRRHGSRPPWDERSGTEPRSGGEPLPVPTRKS
jgi:O-antigen/teichoic acid export membrane protein